MFKEIIKSVLRKLCLYKQAVYVYGRIDSFYAKFKNMLEYSYSSFENAKYRYAEDGLPFPPTQIIYLVTNKYQNKWFYETGVIGSQCIRDILKKNNFEINEFEAILDFGCGCGRIVRHWKTLQAPKLYGTDYNPILVKWCKDNLPFAEFAVNGLESKLIYEAEKFDFIYAISVFTHLTEDIGFFGMKELNRVLKPGGVMFLTFMGTTRAPHLRQELRDLYESGNIVVLREEESGKNICAVFHPEQYVRNNLAKEFRILDFVPCGAKDANQDVFLLQKY